MLTAQLLCIQEIFLGETPKYLLNAAQKLLEKTARVHTGNNDRVLRHSGDQKPAQSDMAFCSLRISFVGWANSFIVCPPFADKNGGQKSVAHHGCIVDQSGVTADWIDM